MNSDKFKLRKIFATSFAFSIMAGSCSNAVDQTIENKPTVSVSEPSNIEKKLRHHERVLGKIVAGEVVDAMVLGTCAFLGGNLVYNITKDVCQFIKKSKTIENFKISELSGSSICVYPAEAPGRTRDRVLPRAAQHSRRRAASRRPA